MTVQYEWDVEEVEDDEILDHHHDENVRTLLRVWFSEIATGTARLVLVKNVGNDVDGLIHRAWAYVENDKLPDEFDDGSKVPQRFKRELEAAG